MAAPDYATYPCLGGSPGAMQDLLLGAYRDAAAQDGAILVPVGEAWRAVIASYPSIDLFSPDGSHPSVADTHLSACVFYVSSPVRVFLPAPQFRPASIPRMPCISETSR